MYVACGHALALHRKLPAYPLHALVALGIGDLDVVRGPRAAADGTDLGFHKFSRTGQRGQLASFQPFQLLISIFIFLNFITISSLGKRSMKMTSIHVRINILEFLPISGNQKDFKGREFLKLFLYEHQCSAYSLGA